MMKGQHQAEFAWFGALSSLPLISIDAKRAARKFSALAVAACRT